MPTQKFGAISICTNPVEVSTPVEALNETGINLNSPTIIPLHICIYMCVNDTVEQSQHQQAHVKKN